MTGSVSASACSEREGPQRQGEWERVGEEVTLGQSLGPSRGAGENRHPLGLPQLRAQHQYSSQSTLPPPPSL